MVKKASPNIDRVRHSLSHLLAAAVLKKFPDAKLGIGPTIENGFYYDFLVGADQRGRRSLKRGERGPTRKQITIEDLPKIEKEMRRLIKKGLTTTGKRVTPTEARKLFKNQPFKLDLIKGFTKDKKNLTVYVTGTPPKGTLAFPSYKLRPPETGPPQTETTNYFIDLCKGGHVKTTKDINPDAFQLTSVAGAYWRGDEKNPQLQRIYGVAFHTKKELNAYQKIREEAEKRDHRKLGQRLKLFTFSDLVGKGLPLWLPHGTIIKDEIEKLAVETEKRYGYVRVASPHIAKEDLFLTSGHLPYYKDDMYPAMKMDDGTYYLKAMNCPHHHVIYMSKPRSYRELPLRLAEYGTVYRNELSGTLAGLLRVRMLSMNDAHIYCTREQIEAEIQNVVALTLEYFKLFGLKDYWFRLSKWDPRHKEKYIDEPKSWAYAETVLRRVLKSMKVKFEEVKDEATFYGPKIDVQFKSVIGREESMSTIQLDFVAKKRFGLTYTDKNGKDNHEVFVIHRAPLSTHERFMAFIIEHFAGAFPVWLAPVQVALLPVSEKQKTYAKEVHDALAEKVIRVELHDSGETLGKRIREAELQKIPYVLVVGENEKKKKTVNVRHYTKGRVGELALEKFVERVKKEIEQKTS